MKYKKGDITFFTKTYSEKHKSCHICKIIKEYPTENKYLVMCTDHYVVGHHFFSVISEHDLLPITESFLSDEYDNYLSNFDCKIELPILNIYKINSEWIDFLNSGFDSYNEFIKNKDTN